MVSVAGSVLPGLLEAGTVIHGIHGVASGHGLYQNTDGQSSEAGVIYFFTRFTVLQVTRWTRQKEKSFHLKQSHR